jgi:hypothetical protein
VEGCPRIVCGMIVRYLKLCGIRSAGTLGQLMGGAAAIVQQVGIGEDAGPDKKAELLTGR